MFVRNGLQLVVSSANPVQLIIERLGSGMQLQTAFMTTVVGSFPHLRLGRLCERLVSVMDIPAWPQLPQRSFLENMYVQFTSPLPKIVVDQEAHKITIDTRGDLSKALLPFYERYLADDVDAFALPVEYAVGFLAMLKTLRSISGEWVKGQVTGPISLGLTITDQDLRPSLYNDLIADVLTKNAAMNASWQIRKLREVRSNVIISVDEPYMASYGSAYVSLNRSDVVARLDEVFAAIHEEGAFASVHCCANTDWSVLLETSVDILNVDAFAYLENLALYPDELNTFLERGGVVAWGIVPNDDEIYTVNAAHLAQQLLRGFELIREKAAARGVHFSDSLVSQSIVTTSCGLGPASVEISDLALDRLIETAHFLRKA
jgi:methionine synthase II (cobalamin-independent)